MKATFGDCHLGLRTCKFFLNISLILGVDIRNIDKTTSKTWRRNTVDFVHKLAEWKVFRANSVGIKSADLKDEFLL